MSATMETVYDELLTVCNAARDLLAALDKMYGGEPLSLNATEARERLRAVVSVPRDPRDERPKSALPR